MGINNVSMTGFPGYILNVTLSFQNTGTRSCLLGQSRCAYLVASCSLVSIPRPHHEDVGHGSEGGQVLNGLVGGAVLSQTNGVVSHHKDSASLQV